MSRGLEKTKDKRKRIKAGINDLPVYKKERSDIVESSC